MRMDSYPRNPRRDHFHTANFTGAFRLDLRRRLSIWAFTRVVSIGTWPLPTICNSWYSLLFALSLIGHILLCFTVVDSDTIVKRRAGYTFDINCPRRIGL